VTEISVYLSDYGRTLRGTLRTPYIFPLSDLATILHWGGEANIF